MKLLSPKTIKNTIKILERINSWLNSKISPVQTQNLLMSLAPKILIKPEEQEKIKPYLDNLKNAIDTKDVNNIALTGGYGSGKSSILKTFQFLNLNYKYLNISLASFEDNKEDKDGFERRLEVSILQQMFYQVKPEQIPDSRFKRIVNVSDWVQFTYALSFIIWIFSCFIIFKFNYLKFYDPKLWCLSKSLDWTVLTITILFLSGIGFLIKRIYRWFNNSKINKFNIKGEFEIGEKSDKSVFNQHLEEILYFFERKKYDVVIIEDVDRFSSTDIFTKLRELNILVNSSKSINHPTKFIYAVKDDMFKDKNERVKFFDFIIPVIPFINPSNADEQLKKLISDSGLENTLSVDFISDLVTYVNDIDMRLLINIFHEFQIYSATLNTKLDKNKIFAILLYKNLYPDDFGLLSKRDGKLFKLINSKRNYINILVTEINDKIESINKKQHEIQEEYLSKINELRLVYLQQLTSKLVDFKAFYFDREVSLIEVAKDDYFEIFKNNKKFKYVKYVSNYHNQITSSNPIDSDVKLSSIEKQISSLTYLQREKNIVNKNNNILSLYQEELNKLNTEKLKIDSFSLQEIFTHIDPDDYLSDFANKLLMRNLLLNGYIDEHYEDYITLFHGVKISQIEYEFERNVKGYKKSNFDLVLTNIESLLKRIPEKYHLSNAAWNYKLLEYLIENENKYQNRVDNLFKSFNENNKELIEFVDVFLVKDSKVTSEFIQKLFKSNKGLCAFIIQNSNENDIQKYLKLVFKNVSITDIISFENSSILDEYLSKMDDFVAFSLEINNDDKLIDYLNSKNIKIQNLINISPPYSSFLKKIYEANAYKLTTGNLEILIDVIGKQFDRQKFRNAIFTTVKDLELEKMVNYIKTNLEEFIKNVMISEDGNINESEEVIIEILNNDEISMDLIEELISRQKSILNDLSDITDETIKSLIVSKNKILVNWNNVIHYYMYCSDSTIDDVLFDFLNKESIYKILKNQMMDLKNASEDFIEKVKDLCEKLMTNMDFSDEAYLSLINGIPYKYNKLVFDNINSEKANIIVNAGKLKLTPENVKNLKFNFDNLHIRLFELNMDDFIDDFSMFALEQVDWELIFDSKGFSEQQKVELLFKMDQSLIIQHRNVAESVFDAIPSDLDLNSNYQLLIRLVDVGKSIDKKIELLMSNSKNLNNDQIITIVSRFGGDYNKAFLKQHKPTFENTKENKMLFEFLLSKDLISNYKTDKEKDVIKVIALY